MSTPISTVPKHQSFPPFLLLTPRLLLIPTPLAISLHSYTALYAALHANQSFCTMGFGPGFPAVNWTPEQTREKIQSCDIAQCWDVRGLGDFAVALREGTSVVGEDLGRVLEGTGGGGEQGGRNNPEIRILEGADAEAIYADLLAEQTTQQSPSTTTTTGTSTTEYIGYAGIRDAAYSMPPRVPTDAPLPHWLEMIEIRYGVAPAYWGKGFASEAARAVMQWGVAEKGVRRFIAETERDNGRSAGVLSKMGFVESGTEYWKEPGEVEWERWVGGDKSST